MVSRFLVYGLIDPRNGQIVYVGKSESGLARPKQHKQSWCLRSPKRSKLLSWLKSLNKQNLQCEIEILEEAADRSSNTENEMYWIACLKMLGASLLNMTNGGDGWHGQKHSQEWRARRTKCTLEITQRAIFRYEEGLSIRAVAREFGLDTRTLRTHMHSLGYVLRPNVQPKITQQMVDLVQAEVKAGGRWLAAAERFPHVHPTSFLYHLRKRGLVI